MRRTEPELPPQKKMRPSSRFTQAAKPERGFGILKGNVLNLFVFRLYSSISAVLWPSICFPPKSNIRDFEMGTAPNLVRGRETQATSRQTSRWTSSASQEKSFESLNPENTKMYSSLTRQSALKGSKEEASIDFYDCEITE